MSEQSIKAICYLSLLNILTLSLGMSGLSKWIEPEPTNL